MESRKQAIMTALDAFTRQRAGMDPRNYGDWKSYRAESRSVTLDLRHYRELRRAVELRDSITADMILEASRSAFSGRLTLTESRTLNAGYYGLSDAAAAVYRVEYCTGQYFPTEYRKAACAVLAQTLWYWTREHAMPAPTEWRVESWAELGRNGATRERSAAMQIHAACELLAEKGGQQYGHVQEYIAGKSPGDWLRSTFRREFGQGIARRYFN